MFADEETSKYWIDATWAIKEKHSAVERMVKCGKNNGQSKKQAERVLDQLENVYRNLKRRSPEALGAAAIK